MAVIVRDCEMWGRFTTGVDGIATIRNVAENLEKGVCSIMVISLQVSMLI